MKIKSIFPSLLAILIAVNVLSCGTSEEEKVKSVVSNFTNEVQALNFQKAASFCDEETGKMIKGMGGIIAMMPEEKKAELKKEKMEFSHVEFNKDTAKVFYWEGETIDKTEDPQSMRLVKMSGEWKISIDKESMKKEGKEGKDKSNQDSEGV